MSKAAKIEPIVPREVIFGARARSWVVVSKATGKSVMETFDPVVAGAINTQAYYVFTAGDYLAQVNQQIKLDNPLYFSKPYKQTK